VRSTLIPEIVFDVRDEFPRHWRGWITSSIFLRSRVRRHFNGLTSRSAAGAGRIAGNRPLQTGARFPPRDSFPNQNRDVISKTRLIGAVEIGTSKVTVLVGELTRGRTLNIVGFGSCPARV